MCDRMLWDLSCSWWTQAAVAIVYGYPSVSFPLVSICTFMVEFQAVCMKVLSLGASKGWTPAPKIAQLVKFTTVDVEFHQTAVQIYVAYKLSTLVTFQL